MSRRPGRWVLRQQQALQRLGDRLSASCSLQFTLVESALLIAATTKRPSRMKLSQTIDRAISSLVYRRLKHQWNL